MAGQITTTVQNQVASLYVSLLGRNPDSTGFGFWANSLANAGDTLQAQNAIAIGFSASPEFISVYGGQTTAQAVNLMYTNILGRAPDTNGAAYWTSVANNLIAAGTPVGQAYALTGYQLIWTAANNGSSDSAAVNAKIAAAVAQGSIPGVTTTLTTNATGATWTTGVAVPAGSFVLNDGGLVAGPITLAIPAGASVAASLLTVNGSTTDAITADISGSAWSTVATATINGGGAETITGSAVQGLKFNDTVAAAAIVTVNGGLNNTVNVTASDAGNAITFGVVNAGQTTADAGSSTVTVTSTNTAATTEGAVAVAATTGATVNVTRNETVAATAATITVASTTGNVTVNETINLNAAAGGVTYAAADAITVTGGTTVVVNETVGQISTAAALNTLTAEGAVTVHGNANTTTVTVNQAAVATGSGVVAAVTAITPVNQTQAVTAGPGKTGVTAVTQATATKAAAAKVSAPTVVADGLVSINDKNATDAVTATVGTLAGTITTVSLNNFSAGANISSAALNTLTLAGTGGAVATLEAGSTAATNKTLTVNTNTVTGTTLTDTSAQFKTINVVNTGTSAVTLVDATATAVNVSGSGQLNAGTATGSTLAAAAVITASGAAGFKGLLAAGQTYTNTGTGVSEIGISAAPTKAITAGSSGTDVITVLTATLIDGTSAANLAKFNSNVTGFENLAVGATGTYNVAAITGDTFTGLIVDNGLTWQAAAVHNVNFTNVTAGTSLTINADNTGDTVSYVTSDTATTDAVTVTINGLTTGAGVNAGALTLTNINGVGLNSVSIVSNASTFSTGVNTLATLTDNAATVINASGTGGLVITNYLTDLSASLTLNSTSTNVPASVAQAAAGVSNAITGALTIGTLTDANLANLTFSGSNTTVVTALNTSAVVATIADTDTAAVRIGTLTDATLASATFSGTGNIDVGVLATGAAAVTIANTGTGTVTIGDGSATVGFVDAALTSLTLTGNVAFGPNIATAPTATGVTTGTTLAAGTDNAHINFAVGVTAAGSTDTITVGNGNDLITDASVAGTVVVTAGTGYSLINLSTGGGVFNAALTLAANTINATYAATVTLGAHTTTSTLFDQINVGTVDGIKGGDNGAVTFTAITSSANTVITGLNVGDAINFRDTATSVVTLTAPQLANAAALGTLAAAVAYVDGLATTVANSATAFVYGANTYVLESAAAGTGTVQAADGLVQLVGTHTLTTGTVTAGHVFLAS